jgi:hypothetical protein
MERYLIVARDGVVDRQQATTVMLSRSVSSRKFYEERSPQYQC